MNLDDVATQLLNESLALNGCDRLRGGRKYCCSYHQGFEDGMNILIDNIERESHA